MWDEDNPRMMDQYDYLDRLTREKMQEEREDLERHGD